MKFEFFHLMPYRDLPADFAETNTSVWVDVPSHLFDPAKAHQMYNDGLDELEAAAAAGYDGICINEHHQNAYGLMPSPNLMAANLCRRTKDVAIVVLGNSIALYNPPTRVAEEFAMLDCISGGRLVAGFPVGTPMDDCFCYGANPSHLRDKYYEAADLITQAWTRPEVFSYNGRYNQLRYINIWPRPIQQPHPPVWIPGGGSVETWEWCAEHNYVYCYLSYGGYKAGQKNVDGFWRTMQQREKPLNPYQAGFLQLVAVGESEQEVADKFGPPRGVLLQQDAAHRPALRRPAWLPHRAHDRAGLHAQPGSQAGLRRLEEVRGRENGREDGRVQGQLRDHLGRPDPRGQHRRRHAEPGHRAA